MQPLKLPLIPRRLPSTPSPQGALETGDAALRSLFTLSPFVPDTARRSAAATPQAAACCSAGQIQ